MGGAGRRPSAIPRRNSKPLIDFIVSSGATPKVILGSAMPCPQCTMPKSSAGAAHPGMHLRGLPTQRKIERQRRRVLDLLHGEGGRHLGDLDARDQLLVESVVGGDV